MFIVDGVRYRLWTPKDEEKEFHPIIKEHINEIFGLDQTRKNGKFEVERAL